MTNSTQDSSSVAPAVEIASDALRRVARLCGTEVADADLARSLAQCQPPAEGSDEPSERLEWLARAADDFGLRASVARSSISDALPIIDADQPLATVDATGTRWTIVERAAGRNLGVVTMSGVGIVSEKLSPGGLAERLGVGIDDDVLWLVVDPSELDERSVSSHGEDARKLTPFQRLRGLIRPDRGDVMAVIAYAVTIGILLLATPIAVQSIVQSVAQGALVQPLIIVASLLFVALAFAGILIAVQTWIVELLQRRLFVRMVADLAARLPRVKLEAYEEGFGPERVNRFYDIITIQKAAPKLLVDALGTVLAVFVSLTVLAFYHPLLLAFDIVLLGSIFVLVFGPLRRGERTAIVESTAKHNVAGWLEDVVAAPFSMKSGGSQQWVQESADGLTRRWVDARRTHFSTVFGQVLGALALQVVASTLLLSIGGLLVIQNALTIGQLVAAELIVTGVVAAVAGMGKHLETWYDVMAATHKLGQLLDTPLEDGTGERVARLGTPSKIDLVDVAWRGGGELLFSGLNLQIEPGERVGITGPAGSGKSALVELLWGLRRPSDGSIHLDGRDLRDLSKESLRSLVAVATGAEVLRGTVRENVSLHRPGVSADDVRLALDRVGLTAPVASLEHGMETSLHPGTRLLSEGELRRLVLARAIADAPSLLIVDGLFDAVPRASRPDMLDGMLGEERERTTLIVSDLPDVLERCDRVLTLSGGTLQRAESTEVTSTPS
ncbi:MAG: ATP-binding cassette domain-containing protein [Planctomycetota bacterium]